MQNCLHWHTAPVVSTHINYFNLVVHNTNQLLVELLCNSNHNTNMLDFIIHILYCKLLEFLANC
jgi:hypothetical protein